MFSKKRHGCELPPPKTTPPMPPVKPRINPSSPDLEIDIIPSPRAWELAVMFDELSEADQANIAMDIKIAYRALKTALRNDAERMLEVAR
jgi:hypothetical protein